MIKNLLKRFGLVAAEFVIEKTVLYLIAIVPLSYFAAQTRQWWEGATVMFDSFPPLFWPILSVLVLVVVAIQLITLFREQRNLRRKEQRENYQNAIDDAYTAVSHAHKPQILNPASPGNEHAILEIAQNAADTIRPRLLQEGVKNVPNEFDTKDPEIIGSWYECLRQERIRLAGLS